MQGMLLKVKEIIIVKIQGMMSFPRGPGEKALTP